MGAAYNRFDKKMREEKPGRTFLYGYHCFKTTDSVCEGVAFHSLANHNKIPLTLAHVLKVNVHFKSRPWYTIDDNQTFLIGYSKELLYFILFDKRV